MNLTYRTQTAPLAELLRHLRCCDANFVPPLSSRVDLTDYARKIHTNAVSFEAWDEDTQALVGMVSAYLNDPRHQAAFITNVSVVGGYTGRGIGTRLLAMCVARARSDGFAEVKLEVAPDNIPAMRLYARAGFEAATASGESMLVMACDISERARSDRETST